MEFAKTELAAVEETMQEAVQAEVRELNDLQLALVGGGIGDIVWG